MAGDPETVKVVVRCRPFNKREINLKCKNVVFMDQKTYTCSIEQPNDPNAPPKSFTFDGVYGPDSTTEQIYNDNGFGLVEGVLEGYNGTVFAYGQTGCGKSFSMQGIPDPPTQRGIIPRAFEHIFEAIDSSENMKYLVHASYLEIYNEEIRDLLGKDVKKKLDLRENPDKGIYVDGISTHPVHNTQECEMLMDKGWKNRSTGATAMNADSSRSHSIFTINIEMLDTGVDGGQHIRKGKLNLVDLAGSERQSKTQAEGQRLKEANKINLSLSALGNVISALVDGKSTFIPYRDSKLTRMLQDSLGGNTKTMMVACLSPADNNYDETLSTLRYANRAKNIKNKPKINEDPKDALLREYQSEIQKLKEMLDNKPESSFVQAVPNEEILEAERRRVREEYDKEMQEIKQKFQSEQQSKAKMQEEIEEMRRHYEEKLQQVNERSVSVTAPSYTEMSYENEGFEEDDEEKKDNARNEEQIKAMEKLRKLQEAMLEGGKRAGDKDLKERRLKKKKAAEKRLKVLGEALGHVDGEDGVLVKVYDDIQTELSEKTAALKRMKQRVKGLNSEISDLHSEFEKDRQDYLDTIRKQDQQLLLLQTILDKVQPTLRKDCNYSNIDKIKSEASWNDELESWYVPELVIHKTKLPPAGPMGGLSGSVSNGNGLLYPDSMGNSSTDSGSGRVSRVEPGQGLSRTAPGRLQIFDDDSGDEAASHLVKKLAKSEEEDIAGNYFKPKRANRLMAQAQMDKTSSSRSNLYSGSTSSAALLNSTLATSFNSGLNTVGLNNSYVSTGGKLSGAGMGGMGSNDYRNWGQTSSNPSWLSNGGGTGGLGGYSSSSIHAAGDIAPIRKPTRLEALPGMGVGAGGGLGKSNIKSKKSVPVLNTMGTF